MTSLRTKVVSGLALVFLFAIVATSYSVYFVYHENRAVQFEMDVSQVEAASLRLADTMLNDGADREAIALEFKEKLESILLQLENPDNASSFNLDRKGVIGYREIVTLKALIDSGVELISSEEEVISTEAIAGNLATLAVHLEVVKNSVNSTRKMRAVKLVTILVAVTGLAFVIFFMTYVWSSFWMANINHYLKDLRASNAKVSDFQLSLVNKGGEFQGLLQEISRKLGAFEHLHEQLGISFKDHSRYVNEIWQLSKNTESELKETSIVGEKFQNFFGNIKESRQEIDTLVTGISAIAEKIDVINKLSVKTQLLAINAAVQASKASEAGKQFTIVAEEMGKLATVSRDMAKEISEDINSHKFFLEKIGKMASDIESDGYKIRDELNGSVSKLRRLAVRSRESGSQLLKETSNQSSRVTEVKSLVNEIHNTITPDSGLGDSPLAAAQHLAKYGREIETASDQLNVQLRGNGVLSVERLEQFLKSKFGSRGNKPQKPSAA